MTHPTWTHNNTERQWELATDFPPDRIVHFTITDEFLAGVDNSALVAFRMIQTDLGNEYARSFLDAIKETA